MRRRKAGLSFKRRKKQINTDRLKELCIWAGEILLAMVCAVLLVACVGFRVTVAGPSMEPTLKNGEEILVNRFEYKLFNPKQKDRKSVV